MVLRARAKSQLDTIKQKARQMPSWHKHRKMLNATHVVLENQKQQST